MQTFLPHPDFAESARALDVKRLGKQRVEAMQILNCLLGVSSQGWQHHPAIKMWKGHEYNLAIYGMAMCVEWEKRGYKDNLFTFFYRHYISLPATKNPRWIGDEKFHRSHQSNLLSKAPEFYRFDVPDNLPYEWPK